MNKIILASLLVTLVTIGFVSCDKQTEVIDKESETPAFSKFNTLQPADSTGLYFIRSVNNTFKVPIGITNVSNVDRTIQLTYTSNSAVAGQQYTAPATMVIPAGKAVDSLVISGIFAGYPTTTKVDTLIITITGGDVPVAGYKNRYRVIMRKYCDVVPNSFLGAYPNTNELFGTSAYGPYTTTVSSVTSTGPTSARIVVTNIWDFGWGPISFDLDWSSPIPTNFTATVVPASSGIGDAGTISATYAGMQIQVRPYSGNPGTFNSCNSSLQLKMQLGVVGLGWFSQLYQVNMSR